VTELQKLYLKARAELHCGHRKAIDVVAAATGIDPRSVGAALARARREDERDERRARKEKVA
jgi:hypothetical protein